MLRAMPSGLPLLMVTHPKAREPTIRKGGVDPKGRKIRAKIEEGKPTVYISLLPRMSSQARIQRRGISKGKLRPVRHFYVSPTTFSQAGVVVFEISGALLYKYCALARG
jgi:hypothetical protein